MEQNHLERFRQLLSEFRFVADAARLTGRSVRSLHQKRHGERGVDYWDVLAMERAVQLLKQEEQEAD